MASHNRRLKRKKVFTRVHILYFITLLVVVDVVRPATAAVAALGRRLSVVRVCLRKDHLGLRCCKNDLE